MGRRQGAICIASLLLLAATERPAEVGAVLEARSDDGSPIHVRIDGIEADPKDAEHEVFLYRVSIRTPTGEWRSYCDPDRQGVRAAIPLSGSWDLHGDWSPADGAITFACTSGAIGKCVRFGYKPWKSVAGQSLRDYHTACTRMVRADYCGSGVPHTKNGTWIDLYDVLDLQKRLPDAKTPPVLLEAGWSPRGATYVNRARWDDELSAIAAQCPETLRGQVALPGGRPLTAEEIRKRRPDTLLFNDRLMKQSLGVE